MVFQKIAVLMTLFAIALGAFGAHALQDRLSEHYQEVYQTATLYLLFHSLAILCLCCAEKVALFNSAVVRQGCWILLLGVIIFSGSLYALVLLDIRRLGMITPVGGVLLLVGWGWILVRG